MEDAHLEGSVGPSVIAPPPSVIDADRVRLWLVKAAIFQFNLFVAIVLGTLIWKGWEMPPTANSLIMIIVTAETNVITAAVSFYLGSSVKGEASGTTPPKTGGTT